MDNDEDEYYEVEGYTTHESLDPVVRRGDLLIRLAEAVCDCPNKDAREKLLSYMEMTSQTIRVGITRGEIEAIHGGSNGKPN